MVLGSGRHASRPTGRTTLVVRLHYPYARLPSLLWGTHTAVTTRRCARPTPSAFGHDGRRRDGPVPAGLVVGGAGRRRALGRLPGCAGAPFLRGAGGPPTRIEWSAHPRLRPIASRRSRRARLHVHPRRRRSSEVDRLVDEGALHGDRVPAAVERLPGGRLPRVELRFDDVRLRARCRSRSTATRWCATCCTATERRATAHPPGDEHYDPAVDRAGRHDPAEAARDTRRARLRRAPTASASRRVGCRALRLPGRRGAAAAGRGRARPAARGSASCSSSSRSCRSRRSTTPPRPARRPSIVEVVVARPDRRADRVHGDARTSPSENWQHASIPALDAAFDALAAGARRRAGRAAARGCSRRWRRGCRTSRS